MSNVCWGDPPSPMGTSLPSVSFGLGGSGAESLEIPSLLQGEASPTASRGQGDLVNFPMGQF